MSVVVEPLANHLDLVTVVARWFVSEWPAWYGIDGPGDVIKDLQAFSASVQTLPVGLVAFENGRPVGAGALKAESIPSHTHLSPWAAAGFVLPVCRGRGIGGALLAGIVVHARSLGHPWVYCGTSTSKSLLERSGWSVVEITQLDNKPLTIFRSAA